jgi:ribulose-phosphate 3-epimerase
MAQILPSINCHHKDLAAVAARCKQVAEIFAAASAPEEDRWAHFDVADGIFTFHKSWDEPQRLKEIAPQFAFETHLMVADPRPTAERWLAAGARRVVVHLEAASPELFEQIAVIARAAGAEIALALNPETPAAAAEPYFGSTSQFLVLAVHPGLSGQKFLPVVLEKVSFLRREVPDAKIEVDGGITPETARTALAAGADSLVSGADIFENPDPAQEYQNLRSLK